MNVDDALGHVGRWGRYQKYLYVLMFIAGIPNAFVTMQFVISHYEPDFHCKLPQELLNSSTNSEEYEAILDYAIPKELDSNGEMRRSRCHMYARNYSSFFYGDWMRTNDTVDIISCTNGFSYHATKGQSAVMDFNMVCNDEWKAPVAASIFHVGKGVGSLCGTLADRVGRRTVFLWSALVQVLSTIFIGITWNYYLYFIGVFASGFSAFINYLVTYVLATELMAVEWRNFIGIGMFYSYFVGYAMMPALTYLIPNWRYCFYAMSILTAICYCPHYWFLPESARWQLLKGKTDEAIKELRKIGKMNKKTENFDRLLQKNLKESGTHGGTSEEEGLLVTFRMIFKSGISARCITTIYGWFVACIIYYVISYYSTSFSPDRYLNFLFACLAELPSYIIAFYMLKYIGRPRPLLIFMLTSGLSSIFVPFIPEDYSVARTIVSMAGKLAVAAVFYNLYLSTAEIVPTLHRSSMMFLASCIGRIGSFLAAYVVYLEKINPALPGCAMGALALICAVTSVIYIPETKGVKMPDSIKDAKDNKRFYRFNFFKKMPKDGLNTDYRAADQNLKKEMML